MTRITRERLIAFAAGELEGPEAEEVAAHVAANPEASRTVSLYRTLGTTVREEDTRSAPADLVARAKAIFRAESPARRGLVDRLQDVIAHLVYDSRLQAAATRATAEADRIQLAFEAGDYEIDLRAEPATGEAPSDTGPRRWRVVGQVLSEAALGRVTVGVLDAGTQTPVAEVEADDRAMFALDLDRGRYDLRVGIGDEVFLLSGVDIG